MTATETKIYECIKPIIEKLGYRVYDVICEKEGKDQYLRIFIDNDEGISINDCETVNNAITDILDEKDFIKTAYMLEVSSPGIERRLRSDEHYLNAVGNKIEINTFSNIENINKKHLLGILKETRENEIVLETDKGEITIDKSNISKANLAFEWN